LKIIVTAPTYLKVEQYRAEDSAAHATIIVIVGGARLQWLNNGVLRVHVGQGDEAAWVTVGEGDWVGECDLGCAHVLTDEEVNDTDQYREVHES
jgi:hypothetical protein